MTKSLVRSLRAYTLIKNYKRNAFNIIPTHVFKPEKLDTSKIKKVPRPPSISVENPRHQELLRREAKRIYKHIRFIQIKANLNNEFPKVTDIPDDLM